MIIITIVIIIAIILIISKHKPARNFVNQIFLHKTLFMRYPGTTTKKSTFLKSLQKISPFTTQKFLRFKAFPQ